MRLAELYLPGKALEIELLVDARLHRCEHLVNLEGRQSPVRGCRMLRVACVGSHQMNGKAARKALHEHRARRAARQQLVAKNAQLTGDDAVCGARNFSQQDGPAPGTMDVDGRSFHQRKPQVDVHHPKRFAGQRAPAEFAWTR
jgi:hypothetical protein